MTSKRVVRTRWISAALFASVVIGVGALLAHRRASTTETASPAEPPAPVAVVRVERRDLPVYLTSLGTVVPLNTVTVRPRVDGEIVKVDYRQGQIVRQGALLVQIDPSPYKAALDAAVAKLAEDQANLKNGQQELVRARTLVERGDGTQQTLDQRVATVSNLTALIDADQAAIANAKIELGYTTITAPITGRAGFRLADKGNIVHAADQTGIVTLVQLEPMTVVFTEPEQQVSAIQKAMAHDQRPSVLVMSSDGKRQLASGQLAALDNQVDQASGTIRLKATFPNADLALWPGLAVTTRVLVDTLKKVLTVQDLAVQRGPDGLFAYVVGPDHKAQLHPVKVSQIEGGTAVVETGLAEGDMVISSGVFRVKNGSPVQVLNAAGEVAAVAGSAGGSAGRPAN